MKTLLLLLMSFALSAQEQEVDLGIFGAQMDRYKMGIHYKRNNKNQKSALFNFATKREEDVFNELKQEIDEQAKKKALDAQYELMEEITSEI